MSEAASTLDSASSEEEEFGAASRAGLALSVAFRFFSSAIAALMDSRCESLNNENGVGDGPAETMIGATGALSAAFFENAD